MRMCIPTACPGVFVFLSIGVCTTIVGAEMRPVTYRLDSPSKDVFFLYIIPCHKVSMVVKVKFCRYNEREKLRQDILPHIFI